MDFTLIFVVVGLIGFATIVWLVVNSIFTPSPPKNNIEYTNSIEFFNIQRELYEKTQKELEEKTKEAIEKLKLRQSELQTVLEQNLDIKPIPFGRKKLYLDLPILWHKKHYSSVDVKNISLKILNDSILIDTVGEKDVKIKYEEIVSQELVYSSFLGINIATEMVIKTDSGKEYSFHIPMIKIVSDINKGNVLFTLPELNVAAEKTLEFANKVIENVKLSNA